MELLWPENRIWSLGTGTYYPPEVVDWDFAAMYSGIYGTTRMSTVGNLIELADQTTSAPEIACQTALETVSTHLERPLIGHASASRSAEDLWEKALEALSDEEKRYVCLNRTDKLGTLNDLLAVVQDKKLLCMEKRWRYRKGNQQVIIRDQLEKVIVWVTKFKEIGDVTVQYNPGHASLPWAGIRAILQVAINDSQTFGAMVDGVERISNLVTRYAIIENLYLRDGAIVMAQGQLTQAIIKLYTAILRYLSKARRYFNRNTAKRMAIAIVQSTESSVDPYMDNILIEEGNVDACVRLVQAEYHQESKDVIQRLEHILCQMNSPVNRPATQLSDLYDSLQRSQRRELFQWLSTVPHNSHHKTVGKDFLPNSGTWLLQKKEFIEWGKSSVSSVLWLHGIPGSGKSKLVYSVIEFLSNERVLSTAPAPIAYFYCKRTTTELNRADPDEIMRSILKQLSCLKSDVPVREVVAKEYTKRKEDADDEGCEPVRMHVSECEELILLLLDQNPATIIIDALDECDPARRYELLKALDNIIQQSASLVKVFVSSRDDSDIVGRLAGSPNVLIRTVDNGEDIARFVHYQVEQAIMNKRLLRGNVSEPLKSRIISTLNYGAQGMFQWVKLQIENLCDPYRMYHENDITEELGRLPKSLKESYDLLYERIQQSGKTSQAVAKRTLSWLLCAQRPLLAPGFLAAVSLDLDGQHVTLTIDDLLCMCCNMVTLDWGLGLFQFAHLSVREYFENRADYTGIDIHALAAERCIDICLYDQTLPSSSKSVVQVNNVFLPYAALYWPVHYHYVQNYCVGSRLQEKLKRFILQTNGTVSPFTRWMNHTQIIAGKVELGDPMKAKILSSSSSPPTPLFLACCFGIPLIIQELMLSANMDWNRCNLDGNTSMGLAARHGHEEIVQLLLETNADSSRTDRKHGRAPLHEAVRNGNEPIVRMLLKAKVDIDVTDNSGETPLFQASERGAEVVVQQLLDAKAHTNIKEITCGKTALHQASENGHVAVVRLLLDAKADVNTNGHKNGRTPLQEAAKNGHATVVRLLLGAKADFSTQKQSSGWTALMWAVTNGHEHVVRVLLEANGDANKEDDKIERTALHAASLSGDQAIVRLLLAAGADINAKDEADKTALHQAAGRGYEAVVRLLIDAGADVNTINVWGETALHQASANGNEAVARLLINTVVDINMGNNFGETALHQASGLGREAVARLLIDANAEINGKTRFGTTALHYASGRGCVNMSSLLLGAGADPDVTDNLGETALQKAKGIEDEVSVSGNTVRRVREPRFGRCVYRYEEPTIQLDFDRNFSWE